LAADGLDRLEYEPSDIFSTPPSLRRDNHYRRSRLEMMLDVLRVITGEPQRPTRVMYKANLCWTVCKDLLNHLAAKGLIMAVSEGDRTRYELTAKGREVVDSYLHAVSGIDP
jgi:predicted transcriptional regulator